MVATRANQELFRAVAWYALIPVVFAAGIGVGRASKKKGRVEPNAAVSNVNSKSPDAIAITNAKGHVRFPDGTLVIAGDALRTDDGVVLDKGASTRLMTTRGDRIRMMGPAQLRVRSVKSGAPLELELQGGTMEVEGSETRVQAGSWVVAAAPGAFKLTLGVDGGKLEVRNGAVRLVAADGSERDVAKDEVVMLP